MLVAINVGIDKTVLLNLGTASFDLVGDKLTFTVKLAV